MSLRGRYVIDTMKRWLLKNLNWAMPVPSYGSPDYWERAFRSTRAQPDAYCVIEWGSASYDTLETYTYRRIRPRRDYQTAPTTFANPDTTLYTTTLLETLGVTAVSSESSSSTSSLSQNEEDSNSNEQSAGGGGAAAAAAEAENHGKELLSSSSSSSLSTLSYQPLPTTKSSKKKEEPILILGCGTSLMGAEMVHSGKFRGPIIQIDWSAHIIYLQGFLCRHYLGKSFQPPKNPRQEQQKRRQQRKLRKQQVQELKEAQGKEKLEQQPEEPQAPPPPPLPQAEQQPEHQQQQQQQQVLEDVEEDEGEPMILVQDNATELSSISQPNSIHAVIDKGLMDPLSCTYDAWDKRRDQIDNIFASVHRVLKPHGYYCVWSLSQPEFFLDAIQQHQFIIPPPLPEQGSDDDEDLGTSSSNRRRSSTTSLTTTTPRRNALGKPYMWQRLEIRHDVKHGCLLYRFQKASEQPIFLRNSLQKTNHYYNNHPSSPSYHYNSNNHNHNHRKQVVHQSNPSRSVY
ncbi:hypothetical protein ACA910_010938 [Epithemia clementina (nom. ined.)]